MIIRHRNSLSARRGDFFLCFFKPLRLPKNRDPPPLVRGDEEGGKPPGCLSPRSLHCGRDDSVAPGWNDIPCFCGASVYNTSRAFSL
jgi:hypothetical protein